MNIGLPGTGIGGLFYFFSALVMLWIEIVRLLRRKKDTHRSRIARRVIPMLMGIILSMLFLDWVISIVILSIRSSSSYGAVAQQSSYKILTLQPILLSMITLAVILLSVHIMKFIVRLR